MVLDVVVGHLRLQAAHEDLAVTRLRLLGVHLLAVDDVLCLAQHLQVEGGGRQREEWGGGRSGGFQLIRSRASSTQISSRTD